MNFLLFIFFFSLFLIISMFSFRLIEIRKGRFSHIDLSLPRSSNINDSFISLNKEIKEFFALLFLKTLAFFSRVLHKTKEKIDFLHLHYFRTLFESKVMKNNGTVSLFLSDIKNHKISTKFDREKRLQG